MHRPCKPTSLQRTFWSQWASNAGWGKDEAAVGWVLEVRDSVTF